MSKRTSQRSEQRGRRVSMPGKNSIPVMFAGVQSFVVLGLSFLMLLLMAETVWSHDFPAPVVSFQQAWFNDLPSSRPPAASADGWRRVELLDNWYDSHRSDRSPAWYRMDFSVDVHKDIKNWDVYLPAVNTNAVVWFNGERIGDGGRMSPPLARNWHRPLYFSLPRNLFRPGDNSLYIHFMPKLSGFGFLGPVYVGPDRLLRPAYERDYLFSQALIGASAVLLFTFTAFISLLWFKRRKDSLYGWFAAGSFSWAFFVFDMYVQQVPVQERLWDTLVFASVGWLVIFMSIFFFRFWQLHYPRYERFLLLFGLFGTLGLYLAGDSHFYFVSSFVWDNLLIVISVIMSWFIITQCMKWPSKEAWLLAIALCIVVACGGHDNLVQMGILAEDRTHLLPYGAPFLIGVVVWMLVQRFTRALEQAEQLNQELDVRVQAKSRELEEQYTQIKHIEREKILAQERERIMRDMHDGTGGHLVAALAQVETGKLNKSVLSQTLQDALDDIRLMIDSLDPIDEDVVAVLAMLRSRLEPRLQFSGIRVIWKVEDVPMLPGLGPEKVLQLMHILYESVTNVIKHAGASCIVFRTGVAGNGEAAENIVIEIEDDGRGFTEHMIEGRGTANMYHRAASIGARLELFNNDRGAVVRILLPLSYDTD